MKNNSKLEITKLTRLVLAAAVGSLIWTGCSSTQNGSYSSSRVDKTTVVSVPVDQTQAAIRPDTRPDQRTAITADPQAVQQPVAETITAVQTIEPGPGTAVFESAGAQPNDTQIQAYLSDLERRVAEMKKP